MSARDQTDKRAGRPKPGFDEIASRSHSAIILGCGGGGDCIQAVPLANYLRRLGVEDICIGGVTARWWRRQDQISLGTDIFSVGDLAPIDRVHEYAAFITPETQAIRGEGKGKPLHEAGVAGVTGLPAMMIGLDGGVKGMVAGLKAVIEKRKADLLVVVDLGSDSFYTGHEATILTPMTDAMSMAALNAIDLPKVFALAGYGCDAEICLEELEKNVAKVMRNGGYLGGYGLTQGDVADLGRVFEAIPNETVETWPYRSAKGDIGVFACKRFWSVRSTPLAAVTMFFDCRVICDVVNPFPDRLANSTSVAEAEKVFIDAGVIPESRLRKFIPLYENPEGV